MNKREFGCLCVAIENYLFFSPLSLLFIVFCLKMAKEEVFSSFFRLSLVIFFKNRVLNNIGDYVMKKSKKCTPPPMVINELFYLASISEEEYERFSDIFSMNQAERAMSLFEEKAGWKEKRYEE